MTNDKKATITLRQFGYVWRASVKVRPEVAKLEGVTGTQTEEPWIGGEGPSPEKALRELYENIGRVMVVAVQPESEG